MKLHLTCAFALSLAAALGCGGGGGTDSAEVSVTVDGADAVPTEQSSGVDAAGNSFVVIAGASWSLELRFGGRTPGEFSSASSGGAEVVYTDAQGNSYVASDVEVASSYTISVTTYTGGQLEGTFMVTVIGSGGASHTISGTFSFAFAGINTGDPYGGTYIGMFRARGQVQVGTDPNTGVPIWGPLQIASLRVTVKLELLAAAGGIAAYYVVHANVSDALFGCNIGGCVPNQGSVAALPQEPGTPTPGGPSQAGAGFSIQFPGGALLQTWNDAGALYTSTDGRVLSNSLGIEEPWDGLTGPASGTNDYLFVRFGDYFSSLNPATRSMDWALTRSAL